MTFAASWLTHPGLVRTGSLYRTDLYWNSPANKPVSKAKIALSYDPERTLITRFLPADGLMTADVRLEPGSATVALVAENPVKAEIWPDGMFIGTVEWQCQAEGETCMDLSVTMSPTSKGWELCVEQKREETKCLCVNVIYRAANAGDLAEAQGALRRLVGLLSSTHNVEQCCPVFEMRQTHFALNVAQLGALMAPGVIGADGAVSNGLEQQRMVQSMTGQRARCINLFMLPLNWADGRIGSAHVGQATTPGGGRVNRGVAVVNPGSISGPGGDRNVVAHEFGHVLGLNHFPANTANVMHPTAFPSGRNLTSEQCRTIWQNLDNYEC